MISFGIPAESTGQIIQQSRVQNTLCDTEGSDVFISLSAMFKQSFITPHGLILKSSVSGGRKVILLTPKIEKDMEIPEENIHRLPQVLSGIFIFFKGVFFSKENPVFIINTEKLSGCIK